MTVVASLLQTAPLHTELLLRSLVAEATRGSHSLQATLAHCVGPDRISGLPFRGQAGKPDVHACDLDSIP